MSPVEMTTHCYPRHREPMKCSMVNDHGYIWQTRHNAKNLAWLCVCKLFLCYHNMLKSMTSLHYNDCLTMGLTWDKMTWFPVGPCSHSGSDSTYLLYTFMYGTPVHTHSQRNGTMILIFFFFSHIVIFLYILCWIITQCPVYTNENEVTV